MSNDERWDKQTVLSGSWSCLWLYTVQSVSIMRAFRDLAVVLRWFSRDSTHKDKDWKRGWVHSGPVLFLADAVSSDHWKRVELNLRYLISIPKFDKKSPTKLVSFMLLEKSTLQLLESSTKLYAVFSACCYPLCCMLYLMFLQIKQT